MEKELCGLYRFKNKKGEILYIGKADDIHQRLWTHRHLSINEYKEIASIEYTIINNKANRDILELLLILKNRPKFNKQLMYNDEPTLLITNEIELLWNKEEYIDKYLNRLIFLAKREQEKKEKQIREPKGRRGIHIEDISNFKQKYDVYLSRGITKVQFAQDIGVSRPTLDKLLKEYEILNIK